MTRFMRGLSKRPHRKPIRNADRQLTLTRDCFAVKQVSQKWWELTFGSKKKTAGRIRFRAHRRFEDAGDGDDHLHEPVPPARLQLRGRTHGVPGNRGGDPRPVEEAHPEELAERTIGGDVGVKIRLQLSNGESFNLSEIEKTRIARKDFGRRRHQRRLARMNPGSSNYRKQTRKIAKTYRLREERQQQLLPPDLAQDRCDGGIEVVALEDLNVAGMVRRPKPKYDDKGRAQPSGAAAKSGLTKAVTKATSQGCGPASCISAAETARSWCL